MLRSERLAFYTSVFVASLGLGVYVYFVPIYAQRFHATFLDLGFIGSAGSITYAIAPFFVGQLADRVSRRALYAAAVLINLGTAGALIFSRSVNDIILIQALGGLGGAFFWPTAETLVLDLAVREERVKEMGRYSISWGSAYLIGPFLGGVIIQSFGFLALFVTSCALSLASFLGPLFLISSIGNSKEVKLRDSADSKITVQLGVVKRLIPWYGLMVCYGFIFSIISSIFPGYANSIGVGAVLVGIIFTVFGTVRVATYAMSEHYLNFGERRALALASLLLAVCCVLIVAIPNFYTFVVVVPLTGVCFAILFPISIGLISRHFSESQLGAAVGFYESIYGIGAAIGPVIAGALSILDVRLSFLGAAACGVIMIIISVKAKTYER